MNKYTLNIDPTFKWGRDDFKALFLLALASRDFTIVNDVPQGYNTFNGSIPFSLNNLGTNVSVLDNPLFDSECQNPIGSFDKPVIEVGDIVMSVIPTALAESLPKYYNEYQRFNGEFPTFKADGITLETVTVFMGVSNSSKSDLNNPFIEAKHTIVTSTAKLGELLVNLDIN